MKLGVSSTGPDLDSQIDPRFGRCQYFVIVDSDTMQSEAIQNTAAGAARGAGIQAAQMMAQKGVQAVLTGNLGPNATQALSAAGIQMITGVAGTVRNAVESFKSGDVESSATAAPSGTAMGTSTGTGTTPTPGSGAGYGMGMGRGGGRGGGRGMGFRRFAGTGSMPQAPTSQPSASQSQELENLKKRMDKMQKQLKRIEKRIEELSK
ncbi:MAG: dinitrogenase iron-molybdenum cofactor biosynthesis protein [Candidatus Lokiarchaeota archaeon]|nr:dinitrogenase iron-molybdenum cofactor biosynthesis protein [Candidatus Lokiarchaeota archaeon]